jgi:hypothetical protein
MSCVSQALRDGMRVEPNQVRPQAHSPAFVDAILCLRKIAGLYRLPARRNSLYSGSVFKSVRLAENVPLVEP